MVEFIFGGIDYGNFISFELQNGQIRKIDILVKFRADLERRYLGFAENPVINTTKTDIISGHLFNW